MSLLKVVSGDRPCPTEKERWKKETEEGETGGSTVTVQNLWRIQTNTESLDAWLLVLCAAKRETQWYGCNTTTVCTLNE